MGKSFAANLLRQQGVSVVDTDELARQLVEPGRPALAEIERMFGKEVLSAAGRLCRAELARIVFADPSARQRLEAILHPRIRQLWQAQAEAWRQEGRAAAVVVIPLLFETDAAAQFDKIICVACSAATQHERLQARGWTGDQIAQRNAAQWPVAKKMELADYVIWSEGDKTVLEAQLRRIIR
jgi:dephospho-CoA kinase